MSSNRIPLIGKAFESFSVEEWKSYVIGLIIKLDSKESKSAPNVSIVFKDKRVTLRVKREPKFVTREEISQLAEEYSKTELEILELFSKKTRKIEIRYADNDDRRESDQEQLRASKPTKKNAGARKPRKRKAKDQHQLLEPGHDSHLSAQSGIQPSSEAKK